MNIRWLLALSFSLCSIPFCPAYAVSSDVSKPAQITNAFTEVPQDDKAYQCADVLEKAGIVIGYPDGTYGGGREMTRYEFGVAIARLLTFLASTSIDGIQKGELDALRRDLHQKLQHNPIALDALLTLVNEFRPELLQLKQDVDAAETSLLEIHAEESSGSGRQATLATLTLCRPLGLSGHYYAAEGWHCRISYR